MAAVTENRILVRSQAKWVRSSARKARLVLDTVRGLSVPDARRALVFSTRGVAVDVERVLRSAVANAESVHALDGDDLVIVSAVADEGPTLKRMQPRARGRANRINKRTCHITIVVAQSDRKGGRRRETVAAVEAPVETKPKRRAPAKKTEGAAA